MNEQFLKTWIRVWPIVLCMAAVVAASLDVESLVFYLPCEDAVNPADASADPATVVVHGTLTLVPGQFGGNALGFNGNKANRIQVLNNPKLDGMSALTVEAWIQTRNLASHAGVTALSKRVTNSVADSYNLFIWRAVNGPYISGRLNTHGTNRDVIGKTVIRDDTWYHVAFVFDGQAPANERMKVYVNGVLDGTHSHPDTRVDRGNASLWIGDEGENETGYTWDGFLDEIGIWNTALNETELGDLMLASKADLLFGGPKVEPPFEVVASGLDNPRGLVFAPNGTLYVAEAGSGGDGPCMRDRVQGGELCLGTSGAITEVQDGLQTRVVTGLPSLAGAGGFRAVGPHDLVLGADNVAFVVMGLGVAQSPVSTRNGLGLDAAALGRLLRVDLEQGTWRAVADLVAYEAANDPDGGGVDSNPYAVLSAPGRFFVVDAGGNDLLSVGYKGEVSTLALFPAQMMDAPASAGLPAGAQMPAQAVPTAVALGPDLALYVGELTGVPFKVGGARVYRLVPGSEPEVFAEGFTNIIDIEFRPQDGLLYVLEHAMNGILSGDTTGALIRVNADGSRDVIADDGLVSPGGLAFGGDGAAYITNFSEDADIGQVVRIPVRP